MQAVWSHGFETPVPVCFLLGGLFPLSHWPVAHCARFPYLLAGDKYLFHSLPCAPHLPTGHLKRGTPALAGLFLFLYLLCVVHNSGRLRDHGRRHNAHIPSCAHKFPYLRVHNSCIHMGYTGSLDLQIPSSYPGSHNSGHKPGPAPMAPSRNSRRRYASLPMLVPIRSLVSIPTHSKGCMSTCRSGMRPMPMAHPKTTCSLGRSLPSDRPMHMA